MRDVSALRAVRSCFHIGAPPPAAVALTGRRRHFGPFGDTADGSSFRNCAVGGAHRTQGVGPHAAVTSTALVSTGGQADRALLLRGGLWMKPRGRQPREDVRRRVFR